jgi:MFS family permease
VILQIPLTRLTERPKRILLPVVLSSAFAVVSFLIATVARTFLQWEMFMITITLAEILLTVPSQSVVAFFSRAGNRGTYQGYYSAVSNAGRSLASFIGPTSFAFFAFDPPLSWVTVAIFALATGIGLAIFSPSIQRDFEKQVPH